MKSLKYLGLARARARARARAGARARARMLLVQPYCNIDLICRSIGWSAI